MGVLENSRFEENFNFWEVFSPNFSDKEWREINSVFNESFNFLSSSKVEPVFKEPTTSINPQCNTVCCFGSKAEVA